MLSLAHTIYQTIKDYRNEDGVSITIDSILEWSAQFGADAKFMLQEISHIIPKIYFSKEDAKRSLENMLFHFSKQWKYPDLESFLKETLFLDMRGEGKSQKEILRLLDEIIERHTSHNIDFYKEYSKRNFIYLDDVLASGGTIRNDLYAWLKESDNLTKTLSGEYRLQLYCFCIHTWGLGFLEYGLGQNFPGFELHTKYEYKIENHAKRYNQSYNLIVPLRDQPSEVKNYLASLNATKYEDYAYRDINKPYREIFFSTPENRVKFENLL